MCFKFPLINLSLYNNNEGIIRNVGPLYFQKFSNNLLPAWLFW